MIYEDTGEGARWHILSGSDASEKVRRNRRCARSMNNGETETAAMTIGWIGTGIMGAPMCGHLMAAGHEARVYTRTREKAAGLLDAGAVWADSPVAAAEGVDVLFTIVGYPADVEAVYLGEEASGQPGVLSVMREGTIVVDMTTSSPALAVRIAKAAARVVSRLSTPPSPGGDMGAREARLAIMVGGDQDAFDRVKPLFSAMGRTTELMGGPGSGQHTKMANQILIAGTIFGTVESLIYAHRAGLDLDHVIDVIGSGAASSVQINNFGRRIAAGDMDPGFMIKHFLKDLGIAIDECRRMGIALPSLALAETFYRAAVAQGLADKGHQALHAVIASLNGA
jgi:3-hydroxyisobutyrate dehydrogenase